MKSEALLKVNPDWAKLPLFDRSKWKRVRFGEVVENLNETCDPTEAGIERFIGLEHLEPGSLHIRSWGNVADGTTFTRRCRPGQVLFGKRRAYQRKVAVAEFDAVVSGDIYVLAAKPDRLVPELLPFLCLSERFFKFAVETSAGSLSPRTNWSHLAQFEFALPPLDQQRRIAEILWAVDEVVNNAREATTKAQMVVEAELDEFLYGKSAWQTAECDKLLKDGPKNGFSPPVNSGTSGLPTLSISAIRDGKVITEGNLKYADVQADQVRQFILRHEDILVVRGNGNRSLCGRAGIVESAPTDCFYPDLLIRLRFREGTMLSEFAVLQWNEQKTHQRLLSRAKSTNGIWKINGKDIKAHTLIVPPVEKQANFLAHVRGRLSTVRVLGASELTASALQREIVNAVII